METKNKHSFLKLHLLLLICVVLFSFGVSAASAAGTSDNATIYVNTEGNDTWDGLSAAYNTTSGPKKTITNATGTVAVNGTVHIAQGTYNESGININHNMTITGENQDNTIINGQQSGNSIFTILNGITANINNLTLTNNTVSDGGTIYNGGTLAVINCTFTNNSANYDGGAISNNNGGTLAVINCTFTNNSATYYGGAIFNGGSFTVINSTLAGNSATDGGAIFNGGSFTVINSTLAGNSATDCGTILNHNGSLTVINSTLTGNTAGVGGVIWNFGVNSIVVVHFNRIIGNSPNTSQIYSSYGAVDATLNWWGSNLDPSVYVSNVNGGIVNVTSWLVMNITPDPTCIMNGGNLTVAVDLIHDNTGTYHDPVNGHVPDGIPVTFTGTNGNSNPATTTLIKGQAKTLFTANRAGTSSINATVDNQTVTKELKVNPASYLYLNVTNLNSNPVVGETFIVTYKLDNSGPDNATNVTVSLQIPSGLEFVAASADNGTVTYNPLNRTVIWTLSNVEVGDPYLYLTVKALGTGSYTITPTITSETFNRNTNPLMPFSINVQKQNNSNNSSNNTVNAASTTKTVPMQNTGMPIAGLVLAILAVLGGVFTPRKK